MNFLNRSMRSSHVHYMDLRATTRGKTGKTIVLSRFWKIERGSGGTTVMWLQSTIAALDLMDLLIKSIGVVEKQI